MFIAAQLVKKFLVFEEFEYSLPCPQELALEHYPEPTETAHTPHPTPHFCTVHVSAIFPLQMNFGTIRSSRILSES
jgi:hypothetical protein